MKVVTALGLAISALASAAPNANKVLLSARQEEYEYSCSCMSDFDNQDYDNARTSQCCSTVKGNLEYNLHIQV
jgi:hypothetical protein